MEYWTAFILGLAGSLHCAGMCGPLVLALPRGGSPAVFVAGRVAYNLARVVTYCALGILFGAFGAGLAWAGIQRWVSIGLGVVLLVGWFGSRKVGWGRPVSRFVARLKTPMGNLLRRRSLFATAVLGLLNGLLPCGLVYVAGAAATATGGVLSSVGYMAAFGAGTIPMMLVIPCSGRLVPFSVRLRLQRAIPAAVILLAALLIMRGLALGIPYLSPGGNAGCCHPAHEETNEPAR